MCGHFVSLNAHGIAAGVLGFDTQTFSMRSRCAVRWTLGPARRTCHGLMLLVMVLVTAQQRVRLVGMRHLTIHRLAVGLVVRLR